MDGSTEEITQETFNAKATELLNKKEEAQQKPIKSAAEKAPEERTPEEQAEVDGFTGEVLDAIPGSNQLTEEQRRSLAINLNMSNTKYGAGTVRGTGSAADFVGEGAAMAGKMAVADVSMEESGQLSAPAVGTGQGQNNIERS